MMRRLNFALIAVTAGLLLSCGPSGAQAPTPAAPPPTAPGAPPSGLPGATTAPAAPVLAPVSPEAHKEAAALTEMIGVSRQAQQLISIMRGQMIQLVMRSGSKQQDEAQKIVDEILMPDFAAQQAALTDEIVDVWARNFTADDVKALRAFYATPLGQKLIATLPTVTQQGMTAGQVWGQKIYQASIAKHRLELEARGLKF